jgi:hypothetical protein
MVGIQAFSFPKAKIIPHRGAIYREWQLYAKGFPKQNLYPEIVLTF